MWTPHMLPKGLNQLVQEGRSQQLVLVYLVLTIFSHSPVCELVCCLEGHLTRKWYVGDRPINHNLFRHNYRVMEW